jgi:hypothetical protein
MKARSASIASFDLACFNQDGTKLLLAPKQALVPDRAEQISWATQLVSGARRSGADHRQRLDGGWRMDSGVEAVRDEP